MTNMSVNFEGYVEEVMGRAIKRGIVKTKIEALRLGLILLDEKFKLHEKEEDGDDGDYFGKKEMQKMKK
ncbi:hypothetical protein COV61_01130 [Candidatus Micrarchaeota archaeon CG11_big_fil_rev_8_21_14_0_20_47_5]|nr:MAG: hypothetical protein AUJ17_05635 [Candidatus Micrarchaeota archaeon CG1_02_47_40]PIN84111.1 MAG: hypothetical protein COV61_01130 [Candidatus Micrarchaeota archaeon CG11_big_fil_rev_8_21_14_0_20_47_5]